MKKEIETIADIQLLVDTFYEKVKTDPVIGSIFTEQVKVNWEKHLPVMYRFWENSLFYTGSYEGNPMEIHKHLNRAIPLSATHFKQWTKIFIATVDELFEGTVAALAKQRAISISTVMQIKISAENTTAGKIF